MGINTVVFLPNRSLYLHLYTFYFETLDSQKVVKWYREVLCFLPGFPELLYLTISKPQK